LDKLTSSQGNKNQDIDKRKKKEEVQVLGTLGVMQTPTNIENLEQDVYVELLKFQDFLNCVV
jgi:hypothetical protein